MYKIGKLETLYSDIHASQTWPPVHSSGSIYRYPICKFDFSHVPSGMFFAECSKIILSIVVEKVAQLDRSTGYCGNNSNTRGEWFLVAN